MSVRVYSRCSCAQRFSGKYITSSLGPLFECYDKRTMTYDIPPSPFTPELPSSVSCSASMSIDATGGLTSSCSFSKTGLYTSGTQTYTSFRRNISSNIFVTDTYPSNLRMCPADFTIGRHDQSTNGIAMRYTEARIYSGGWTGPCAFFWGREPVCVATASENVNPFHHTDTWWFR